MEPPLKSRACGPGHLRQLPRVARSLSAPNRCDPLIENCQARRNGDMPSVTCLRAVRQLAFAADRRTGLGLRHVLSLPRRRVRFGPTQSPRQERSARLRRLSLGLAFVGPARPRCGRRFPTASGFERFPPFAGERKTLTNP